MVYDIVGNSGGETGRRGSSYPAFTGPIGEDYNRLLADLDSGEA